MELNPDSKVFSKVLTIKQAVASSMLTATARINASLLRPGQEDGMDQVLAEIARQRQGGAPADEPNIFD